MAEMILNWVADALSFSDIIDLYFIVSDLVDIHISETERCETNFFDSLALSISNDHVVTGIGSGGTYSSNTPIGKLVL